MITLNIEVTQRGKQVIRKVQASPKKLARGIQTAVQQAAAFTAGRVRQNIESGVEMWKPPVDTRAMKRGIDVGETRPLKVFIRPASYTPYAKWVHRGTKRMKARPFFEITARRDEKEVYKFFNERLNEIIAKLI